MRRPIVFAGGVVTILVAMTTPQASALSLLSQWPDAATWEQRTEWPVSLVFDATLNTGTVDSDSFFVAPADAPGDKVTGTIEFDTTNVADDTVIFTPSERWILGRVYEIHATGDIEDGAADPFDEVFPQGGLFVANVPMDLERPDYNPSDPFGLFINANVLPGFDVVDPESTDIDKPWTIPGMGATEAWKFTTGRPDVVIAIIDNGLALYNNREVADRLFLNQGELPMPQDGTDACAGYDCNGDGRFSASDYANDPRVGPPPASYPLSPGELIEAFADGVDNDGNGYVDDISGWDFLRNRPEAVGIDEWPEGAHGDDRAKDACAMADNDEGDKPGFCPDCTLLPIRVSDAILASHNAVAQGVAYASLMGARVGVAASGSPDYSWENEKVILDAYENGMILIAASGDELGFHHSFPAAGETVVSVKSIFPIPNIELLDFLPLNIVAFTETYCTNYNEHVHVAGSSGACSSEATANVGGSAGLIISRANDLGVELSPGEVKQLLTMTSDDIEKRCVTLTGGGCQPGFDNHFGYGRPNLRRAMEALGDGVDHAIPPDVRITSPRWWTVLDPADASDAEIEASINARGAAFEYEVQVARGHEPLDGEFSTVASGTGQAPVDGPVASIDLHELFTAQEMRTAGKDPHGHTFIVRVRAWPQGTPAVVGEDRKALAAYSDRGKDTGMMPGLPFDVMASGESSPALYDLDGRDGGRLEIIFGTTDGKVEVFGWDEELDEWARRPGFPVDLRDADRPTDIALAPPAVGDLFGTGRPSIVMATGNGALYAVHPEGNLHEVDGNPSPFVDGFPFVAPRPDPGTPKSFGHGATFAGAPVLYDLDGDGVLEIVAGNFQSQVYAVRVVDADEDGEVDVVPGFPVTALSVAGVVPPGLVCRDDNGDPVEGIQILGTPAVGLLDPHSPDPALSQHLSIIVPTTEVCYNGSRKSGRLYAIPHDGTSTEPSGFLDGWPVSLPAPLADALPIPPLTSGITAAPAVAYDGGGTIIGTGAFAYPPMLVDVRDGTVTAKALSADLSVNISGHGAFGYMEPGGPLHYALPTMSGIKIVEGWVSILRPLLMSWDLTDRKAGPAAKAELEDIHFYVSPAIADVDGDGRSEVIAGSSGFYVHALSPDGTEPPGWPKYTFNWIIASVAAGDPDNDGLLEIIQPTHEGRLLGWEATGPACTVDRLNATWRRFHHDERNTGYLGTDTLPPGVPLDFTKSPAGDGGTILNWDAPGGDWYCGRAARYEIRVGDDPDALRTPEGFAEAEVIDADLTPRAPRRAEELALPTQPFERHFAIRAVDAEGHLGHIALAEEDFGTCCDDDDTADDDDDFSDDDDDDDDACCGC